YAALRDTASAADYARAMEVAVSRQPGSYHRAWSLFLLDHGRRLGEVLDKARHELETRRDIYGWDVLAWALYRNSRIDEAALAAANALSQGTEDAMLYYHAGMIERAAGRPTRARAYLAHALAINPLFDAVHPDSARELLRALDNAHPQS